MLTSGSKRNLYNSMSKSEIIYTFYDVAFCHNRALQDLHPDTYRLLFTTGSFTLTAYSLSSEPDVQLVQRVQEG